MNSGRRNPSHQVIFVDEHIIVASKAPGVPCIPERLEIPEKAAKKGSRKPYGHAVYDGPALNKILEREYGGLYVISKIDKDTSGLVLFARTREDQSRLSGQFTLKKVVKIYEAIVAGKLAEARFTLDFPLTANGDSLLRTIVDRRKGRRSVTSVTLAEQLGPYALVTAEPATGRIHQIRVHLKTAGFPVLCDPLYGNGEAFRLSDIKPNYRGDVLTEKPLIARTALHARSIRFFHPATGEPLKFTAEYPRDFAAVLYQLRKRYSV